jgi:hypothetical protein
VAKYIRLEKIELGAFNGLTKLTNLVLEHNEIREIIPGTFKDTISLKYLDLSKNIIQHLEVNVFSGLINLVTVILSENKLQYLHPDTFVGLPKLEAVYLGNITSLQVPTEHHFINSRSLEVLDISLCDISSVSVETFANVTALEWLEMSYNNLRSVDIHILKALPKLSAMYLEGNALQCDCQLKKVWRWCKDHNIQTAYGEDGEEVPECDTPSEVKGKWWGVLEKVKCLEDNGDYKNTSYNYTPIDDTDTGTETDMGTEADTETEADTDTETEQDNYVPRFLKQYEVPVYAIPFIFGATGNVIIIIIIICNKDMRNVPNMYIFNLAISDIISLTVLFFEACARRISDTWLEDDFMCAFLPFCRRLSVGLSAYSVAVLSIQRYKVTVNPFHFHVYSQPTWRATGATICGVWIVAALFAVPSTLSKYLCYLYYKSLISGSLMYYKRVVMFELLVSCVLPLCVIAFSYIMAACHLLRSANPISEETQNPQLNTRKTAAKIVLGLTVVFLISYVPYHVVWSYNISTVEPNTSEPTGILNKFIHHKDYELQYMLIVSTFLLLINACLNPVALICTSLAFRTHFKRYLTCCCKTNSPSTDLELARRI